MFAGWTAVAAPAAQSSQSLLKRVPSVHPGNLVRCCTKCGICKQLYEE